MKTARNLTIACGLLLLLYVGAYWRFAKDEMRDGYAILGRGYFSDIEWTNWRKLFVPVVPLDYRVNVERPLRKRCAGHWMAADSTDFATITPDGKCSFRMGEFEHTGTMEPGFLQSYVMGFVRDGTSYYFSFEISQESNTPVARPPQTPREIP